MKIYIASSWKNVHAVEMLTSLLREAGHEVISWVENNYKENYSVAKKIDFEHWVDTPDAEKSFIFDTDGATKSDLMIYLAPSGKDAGAEVGAAWASKVPIIGLFSKGEDFGLMRKMIYKWFDRHTQILDYIHSIKDMQKATDPCTLCRDPFCRNNDCLPF